MNRNETCYALARHVAKQPDVGTARYALLMHSTGGQYYDLRRLTQAESLGEWALARTQDELVDLCIYAEDWP